MSGILAFVLIVLTVSSIMKLGAYTNRLEGKSKKEKYPWYDLGIFGAWIWFLIMMVCLTVIAFLIIIPPGVRSSIGRALG